MYAVRWNLVTSAVALGLLTVGARADDSPPRQVEVGRGYAGTRYCVALKPRAAAPEPWLHNVDLTDLAGPSCPFGTPVGHVRTHMHIDVLPQSVARADLTEMEKELDQENLRNVTDGMSTVHLVDPKTLIACGSGGFAPIGGCTYILQISAQTLVIVTLVPWGMGSARSPVQCLRESIHEC